MAIKIDKVIHGFGSVLEKIKSAPRNLGNAIVQNNKNFYNHQAKKELEDIARGFGSVEQYEKLYPETKKRNDKLRTYAAQIK
jgi:hypothetical protein